MAGFSTKTFELYDDYMTPKNAWESIHHIIPKDKVIWEAFYGNGDSGKYLKEMGFNVIHENIDFFDHNKGDIVVSNPPFSLKKEIVTRLVALDKPFILLMPSATLLCGYMRELIGNDLQIIIPRKRIHFLKLVDGKLIDNRKCNFDCYYFCYKMNLSSGIQYLK
jgi:hypothetical protein